MATGQYLPPVITRLEMNIDDFASEITRAKALIKSLQTKVEIPVNANTAAATAKINALKALISAISGKDVTINVETGQAVANLIKLADAYDNIITHQQGFTVAQKEASDALALFNTRILRNIQRMATWAGTITSVAAQLQDLADAIDRTNRDLITMDASLLPMLAIQSQIARAKADQARAEADLLKYQNQAARIASSTGGGGGFTLWGLNANALHWIVSGGAEIAAVVVPALIALGAAGVVAADGATMVYQHMTALRTATAATSQMFGITAGQAIGLKSNLQQMQQAAQPAVFGILGSAIMGVNQGMGTLAQSGLQTTQNMQAFAAKVVQDFSPNGAMASSMNQLTGHMVQDATGVGQVFGNLGHAALIAAGSMPGLAEALLGILDSATKLIVQVFNLSHSFDLFGQHFTLSTSSLFTGVMAFEEFNRWGGLVAGTLNRIGLTAADTSKAGLAASALSFTKLTAVLRGLVGIIPQIIVWMARLTGSFVATQGIAAGLTRASYAAQTFVAELSAIQLLGIGALAIGVGIVIDKLITAKSAAQQMGAAMQAAVMQSSNVSAPNLIAANMAVANSALKQAQQQQTQVVQSWANNPVWGAVREVLFHTFQGASAGVDQTNSALQQQQTDMKNLNQGAQWISQTYGTTFLGALQLADSANVKLAGGILGTKNALSVQQIQIESMMAGYQAMGQGAGVVGQDMTVLAIQSGLASSQVSNLNSAYDQLMSNMTAGTTGLGGFVQSIANIGTVTATAAQNLGQASQIHLSVTQFANALKSFSGIGAQAWQNFGQVVQSGQQLIDWFRTAGAMGAATAPQMRQAVLGIVGSLTQFAKASPTAQADLLMLAQQVDPNIKTWGQLNQAIQQSGANLNGTGQAVANATIKMGNLAQVAATLGNVMSQQLINTLSGATIAASGVGSAMQKYQQDIMNTGTAISTTGADRKALIADLQKLGYTAQQAAQLVQAVQAQIDSMHSKTVTVTVNTLQNMISVPGTAPPPVVPGVSSPGAISAAGNGRPAGAVMFRRPGYASGTSAAPPGWSWVGEAGPELVRFRGGETVMPNSQSMAFAGGGAGGAAIHEINVYLDGRQIYRAVQTQAVNTQRRTGSNGMQKRSR